MNIIKTLVGIMTACAFLTGCNMGSVPDADDLNFVGLENGEESTKTAEKTDVSDAIGGDAAECTVDDGLTIIYVDNETAAVKCNIKYLGVIIVESKYTGDLKYGDRVMTVNGIKIESPDDIEEILKSCHVGGEISVSAMRNENGEDLIREVKITLQEKIPDSVSFD